MSDDFSEKYLEIIKTEYRGLNLTRILNLDEFDSKQYRDSLIPFEMCPELFEEHHNIIDVGFGGGFPCLPLAYRFQDINVFGVDARNKKVAAVNGISKKMNIKNFKAFHYRLENLFVDIPCIVSFKAVGPIKNLLSNLITNKGNIAVFYKGPNYKELEPGYKNIAGWSLDKVVEYEVAESKRSFLIYKKLNNSPILNKNLVKVSSIISNE